jgi:hypothetical protein
VALGLCPGAPDNVARQGERGCWCVSRRGGPWRGPRMASSSSAAIRSVVVASSFCRVVSAEARSAGTCVIGCWGMSAR